MNFRRGLYLSVTICACSLPAHSFSVPHLFWPQKDIDSSYVNEKATGAKVLIVSRDSDYKRALVKKIKAALQTDSTYVKCTGLTKLKNEDASQYAVIVIFNTCMSWDWDRNIRAFLKRKQDARNVIVLTTSGNGTWKPRRNPASVDAVASASLDTSVEATATTIISKIRALLHK
jgi:hypothetical protein